MKIYTEVRLFLTLFLFIFLSVSAFAQGGRIIRNQGVYYTIEPTYGVGLISKTNHATETSELSPLSLGLKASYNQFINYNTSVGASFGYMRYEDPGMTTLPLLANVKWYSRKSANSPFLYSEGGYSIRFSNETQYKGWMYELGVGYRIRMKKRNNFLFVKLGYSAFKTNEWVWDLRRGDYDPLDPYKWHYIKRQSINITLGYYKSSR